MSSVYLAIQQSIGREVALKVMSPTLAQDANFSERFQREATIVGQLSHPNIISIYDIGKHQGLNYIAMDYLAKGSLSQRLQQGVSGLEAVKILKQLASALAHAHQCGYVHRDIKPENVLFRADDSAVLSDFGVAKAIKQNLGVTHAGTVLGTPNYMSPEQAKGQPCDGRSDLYSLGVMFYEMLSAKLPFQAEEAVAIAIKHLTAPIPKLPTQHALFQPLINDLLAKNPDERIQSGEELIERIEILESGIQMPRLNNRLSNEEQELKLGFFQRLQALMFFVTQKLRRPSDDAAVLLRQASRYTTAINQNDIPLNSEDHHGADTQGSSRRKRSALFVTLCVASLSLIGYFYLHSTSVQNDRGAQANQVQLVANNPSTGKNIEPPENSNGSKQALNQATANILSEAKESLQYKAQHKAQYQDKAQYQAQPQKSQPYTGNDSIKGSSDAYGLQTSRNTETQGNTITLNSVRQEQLNPFLNNNDTQAKTEPARAEQARTEQKITAPAETIPAETITAETIPTTFPLSISSNPRADRTRILNIKPKYKNGILLSPGNYLIEISKKNFQTIKQWIKIGDQAVNRHFTLKKTPAAGSTFSDKLDDFHLAPEMIVIPSGSFSMGSKSNSNSLPIRQVTITENFAVSRFEISFADYQIYLNESASSHTTPDDNKWGRGNRPVINVSWEQAVAYTQWLSEKTGRNYRLLTEAEWEYVARANHAGNYWWPNNSRRMANCRRGCNSDFSTLFGSQTSPLGYFPANPFGVYDTAGNVAEWVLDCYTDHYLGASSSPEARKNQSCQRKTVRGGSHKDSIEKLSSHSRSGLIGSSQQNNIGFRIYATP